MATPRQRFALALVLAFGLGVLVTLERVGTDAETRIRAAHRAAAAECPAQEGPVDMLAQPQTRQEERT